MSIRPADSDRARPISPAAQPGVVAVVGLGKIGLPVASEYARHGFTVVGCDTSPRVVETVNGRNAHVHEEPGLDAAVGAAVAAGRLSATADTARGVAGAAVVVVAVPVVIDAAQEVDFRALDAATAAVGTGLTPGTLVIYETTLPVGTTERRLRPALERASGLMAGTDFSLAYSPERVSSGSVARDLGAYPKVVGGIDEASTAAAAAFYRAALGAEVLCMAGAGDAELVKLIETTYRDVNIALANEFARYADRHGLDIATAIAAANTQPYSHIHEPGVGVGGHCIPVYPHFMLRDANGSLTLPRIARAINDEMATYAVELLEAAVGSLAGATVLILGAAYRGDVRELAFSSARLLQAALQRRGASVLVDDPLFAADELEAAGYAAFREDQAGEVRTIILQANHRAYRGFDFAPFSRCEAVLDGRRALDRDAIRALGMRYLCIGDGQGPAADQGKRGA